MLKKEAITGVYVISYGLHSEDLVKIGYSKDIYKRIADLNQAWPGYFEIDRIYNTKSVQEAKRLETYLHSVLNPFRHEKEWYYNDVLEIVDIIVETFFINTCNKE